MMNKREFLTFGAGGLASLTLIACGARAGGLAKGDFPLSYSEAEWKRRLTEEEYHVLREAGTERAFSSPLNDNKRKGIYKCAGCDNPVYSSRTKFDSGTGWPSFTSAIEGNVGYAEDNTLFMKRVETHCARCGSHLGHVFNDGPPPTGKRHCINGLALDFAPAKA